ncbi:MAG: N-acetylmuramoyl-L-alanine amidase [Phycisphaeraceae bacterium]|nr:N-acetylmuramoyl-L-alanine amidase [Phycisphaeraceae bacterium]MCB9847723.1 N-acetylmuramoyl-L-alanine amidase [Phycisphaeraceae bacterium]
MIQPEETHPPTLAGADPARRDALRLGLLAGAALLLGGCASGSNRIARSTPGVQWPSDASRHADASRATPARNPRDWKTPEPYRGPTPAPSIPDGVTPRSAWAQGAPIPARMDRMLPPQRITIHHDGMDPVTLSSRTDVAQRLEQIRKAHLNRDFGDIGYHFIIDPTGNVWEGRPLTWQGAHVAHQNEHNIGVMCLGNFEVQRPTDTQLSALDRFVAKLMRQYRIPVREIKTHRELASTACPGRNLQPHMNQARASTGTLSYLG